MCQQHVKACKNVENIAVGHKEQFRCFGCLLRDVNFDDFGQEEQNAFLDAHLDDLGFPTMYEPELCGD